jgi:two-component system nitrate/nitrite response regulator NarL
VKLVICDYQRILAEALAAALEDRGHLVLAVTTTAADGLNAVSACRPDICMLDLLYGDQLCGVEAARAISQWYTDTRVLVLSAVTDPETLCQVADSGVAGFLRKDQSVDQIASTLEVIAAGGRVLDPALPRLRARSRVRSQPKNLLDELSPREKEIVARIAEGQSTRQMAFAMNITVGTVRTYVKNVLAKLGAHSRLQLAALASRDGVLIRQASVSAALAPAGAPMAWARSGPVLQNGLGGDVDEDHEYRAVRDSGLHR